MDLVTRLLADRRDRLLMKVGCLLVCFSLVLALMLPQQRAYAVEPVTMTVVASLAVAYFGACGLTFITQNMDKDALVSSVQRLLQEFLDTELGGISIQDWLGTVWDVAVLNTKILMGRPLTNELLTFAQWVAQKYAAQTGENPVYQTTESHVTLADGSMFYLCTGSGRDEDGNNIFLNHGTPITRLSFPIVFSTGYSMEVVFFDGADRIFYYNPEGQLIYYHAANFDSSFRWPMYVGVKDSLVLFLHPSLRISSLFASLLLSQFDIGIPVSVDETLLVNRAPSVSYIPDGIETDQDIALDVGAAPAMDLSQILQQVLQDVLDGTLTSSMEIADAEDVPVDPPAGEITDVDGLGLPALGAALTTRFPFSIPWDFSRAVQLLAAPAKTPYFEVDLLEPIAYRVGGWQGSTKIVLDFSEYEIIGQVSRWTSTIGFCLMLAGATKRLIWTA